MKDERITHGTKFYTPYGTIGVVIIYDDFIILRSLVD